MPLKNTFEHMWVHKFLKTYIKRDSKDQAIRVEVITLPDILANIITIEAVQKGGYVKYAKS